MASEDATSQKAKLLLRLSELGATEQDLATVRESLFASSTGPRTESKNDDAVSRSAFASASRRSGYADGIDSSKSQQSEVNDLLMSFFRSEYSDSSLWNPLRDDACSPSPQLRNSQRKSLDGSDQDEELSESTIRYLDSWSELDIFDFASRSESEGGVLVRMGQLLFARHGFRQRYHIPSLVLRSFLSNLQAGYLQDLPYHNAIHAADVAQSMSHFIVKCGLGEKGDELMRFAAIVAALGHDVGHPGYSNRYLIETRSHLALAYNDHSPLENMHASKLFTTMWSHSDGQNDITAGMDRRREVPRFRKLVVDMILATDNAHHEKTLEAVRLKGDPESVYCAALHAADLGGGGKTIPLAHNWADRVLQEFFRQGDAERVLGLYPVLPGMDRHNPMPNSVLQEGFVQKLCLPLYITLNSVPGIDLSVQIKSFEAIARHWVAYTSEPKATSLKETRSFTAVETISPSKRLTSERNRIQQRSRTVYQGKRNGNKVMTSRRYSKDSGKSDDEDVDEEELWAVDTDGLNSVPPLIRAKSNDEITFSSVRDVRHRLNLSPRAFLLEGLEGGSSDSPNRIQAISSSTAIREALLRARAAKSSDPASSTPIGRRATSSPLSAPVGVIEYSESKAIHDVQTTPASSRPTKNAASPSSGDELFEHDSSHHKLLEATANLAAASSSARRPPFSPRSKGAPSATPVETSAESAQALKKTAQREVDAAADPTSSRRRKRPTQAYTKKSPSRGSKE